MKSTHNHNAMIVSLGLYQGSGGPTKTIASFKKALDADLHMFCKASDLTNEQSVIQDAHPVRASTLPALSQFMWPSRSNRQAVEDAASKAKLISCHSYYRYHALWVSAMQQRFGTPYWFVPHGILDPWVTKKNFAMKKIFSCLGGRRFLDSAKTVIFSTPAERDKALAEFEFHNTDVVPWPVEPVDCSQSEKQREKIRRKLSIPEAASVLLYFGRLHSMKRPVETVRAVAQSPKIHLLLIGNEQDVSFKDCQRVAKEYGAEQRIHWVGPVYGKNKFEYLHAADAYISLSHRENFNHTAAESLAAGLPLILSPGNDIISAVNGVNCLWKVESDNMESAIQAIATFQACPLEERLAMGQRGKDWVARELSFDLFRNRLALLAEKHGRK